MTPINLFVIDTNTLVSGLILPGSIPDRAFRKADGTGRFAFSTETLSELERVLMRPKFDPYLPLSERMVFLKKLTDTALHIPVTHTVTDCRDPKDNKFLELALSASATTIITGDADLLVLHPFQGVLILTPADFLLL